MGAPIPGYDVQAVELVRETALLHYAQSKRNSRKLRILNAACETCESFCLDDSCELFGAIYVHVLNWLDKVIPQEQN